MTIRRAVAGDQDVLARMGLLFHATSAYARLVGLGNLEQLVAFLVSDPQGAAFLLEVQGVAVGMIAGVCGPNHLSGEWGITEVAFYIEPGYRLGDAWRELLDAFEAWGVEQGATHSQVIEPAGCRAVGRLYRRRGYVELETVHTKPLEARL